MQWSFQSCVQLGSITAQSYLVQYESSKSWLQCIAVAAILLHTTSACYSGILECISNRENHVTIQVSRYAFILYTQIRF